MLSAIISQNFFVLVFLGYRTSIARYVAKWGIALICLCKKKAPKGGIAPCWGIAGMAEEVSRDRGYRSDSIAVSRDMGPLRPKSEGPKGGRRKGGRGRKLSHFSFCRAFRCCVVYSPCFPGWGEEKVMTIYDAGPLAAGPF